MSGAWGLSRISCGTLVLALLFASRPGPVFAADPLTEIKQRAVLRWGADAEGGAPYVYPNPGKPEELIGFEVDLAAALAAKLGVKAEMVQNQWDQLIPAVDRGNFDIILNGLELTVENQQHIAMSTYDYIGLGIMTAGIYFALSYPASILAGRLERKWSHDRR